MFQEFVDDSDIYHYGTFGGVEDSSSNTYFIIESSFSVSEKAKISKSYSSINIYFQIYDETKFENIVNSLKLLIDRINSYLNENCCIARSIDVKYGMKKKIEFFISSNVVIQAIRRGDFDQFKSGFTYINDYQ